MRGNDPQLASYRSRMDDAKRRMDNAMSLIRYIQPSIDSCNSTIEACNYRINDLKRQIDNEYDAVRICRQAKDRYGADTHRCRAEDFKRAKDDQFSIRKGYIEQKKGHVNDIRRAWDTFNAAKKDKQEARKAFNDRLAYLKSQNTRHA